MNPGPGRARMSECETSSLDSPGAPVQPVIMRQPSPASTSFVLAMLRALQVDTGSSPARPQAGTSPLMKEKSKEKVGSFLTRPHPMSEGVVVVKRALPNFSSFFLPVCHEALDPGRA